MKKRVLKISIWVLFFFLFCTVTAFYSEKVLVPQVTTVKPLKTGEEFSDKCKVPVSCAAYNEEGKMGVWTLQKEKNIWGESEYQVSFDFLSVVEKNEEYLMMGATDQEVVEDYLHPLEEGKTVRKAEQFTKNGENSLMLCVREDGIQLQENDMQLLEEKQSFELGFEGHYSEQVFSEEREIEAEIAIADELWLETCIPDFKKEKRREFFAQKNNILISKHLADKLQVEKDSEVKIGGKNYRVFDIYTKTNIFPVKTEEISRTPVYLSSIPENREMIITEILFGYTGGTKLYPKQAARMLRDKYGIWVEPEELIDLQAEKQLQKKWRKLPMAGLVLFMMAVLFVIAERCWMKAYTNFRKDEAVKTIVHMGIGVLLVCAALSSWYLMLRAIDIPQQYLSPNGIFDMKYYIKAIKTIV